MDKQRYPIGKYQVPIEFTPVFISDSISSIASFPAQLKALTAGLSKEELAKLYREGGWNIQQVVHHCADSHINAFIRFKKSLTEDAPEITGYKEAAWVEMADVDLPITLSVQILEGLHARWAAMLSNCTLDELGRGYFHPEQNRVVPLKEAVGLYAWHGQHHLAHIKLALGN